ncbi:MAG TPA: hypothetical protein VL096_03480 [Pirellulaceae bacterium]|nr:hypothetical protein [Pirellulaceae bacterium]
MVRNWFAVLVAVAMSLGMVNLASAQGRGPGGPGGGGFGGPGGGTFGLLQNEDVKKELDLVDDQVSKLNAINEKLREEMRSQFSGFRDLSQEERTAKFEELRGKMEERTKQVQAEIDDVLLPQQRERLAQINFQQQLRRGGGDTTGLTSDAVVKALNISDEQKTKLEALEKDVAKEIADKVAKARAEGRDKLLAALSPEQQATFKKLMGSEFRFTQQQGRFGGQPGGQPGQRGQRGGNAAPAN